MNSIAYCCYSPMCMCAASSAHPFCVQALSYFFENNNCVCKPTTGGVNNVVRYPRAPIFQRAVAWRNMYLSTPAGVSIPFLAAARHAPAARVVPSLCTCMPVDCYTTPQRFGTQ